MNQGTVNKLLCRCIDHERTAPTPTLRKYWDAQYRKFRALAKRIGWID